MNPTFRTTPMLPFRRAVRDLVTSLAVTALGLLLVPAQAAAEPYDSVEPQTAAELATPEGTRYSYFRVVEGSATLTQVGSGERQAVEPNQPLLVGDQLGVPPGSRLEVLLSDGNLLRLGGGTEVIFERLASSPDTQDQETTLRLSSGHLQLVVLSDSTAAQTPSVETGSATIYTRGRGVYRITAEGPDHTRVTVRDGSAEVVTDRGSLVVRGGEEAWVEGGEWPRAGVQAAAAKDALERWGDELVAQAELVYDRGAGHDTGYEPIYEDPALRYATAPLDRYGDWVLVDGSRAWRPRVAAGWRPYWYGSWSYTPSGWLWVSSEPWGWVPYHYGTWSLDPGYGWIWYPGDVFAPAWVYWYWGPSQVAWIPVGYYSHYYYDHFYGHRHRSFFGFHFGLYGYAGGHAGYYRDWVFCPIGRFGHHGHHRSYYGGRDYQRHTRRDVVPRGVITTDTRGIDHQRLMRPVTLVDELARRRPADRRVAVPRGGEVPDVTPFVARDPELRPELRAHLLTQSPEQGARLAGTPLRPDTVRRRDGGRTPHGPDTAGLTTVRPRDGAERRILTPVRPTSVRPTSPSRPSAVRPATPRQPTSVRPSSPSTPERPTSVRPTSPSRPSAARPATPRRPTSVRPSSPSTPERPTSVRPTSPSRPSAVRPATPRQPTSIRPSSPSTARRPSAVRPATPRGSSSRATPASPRSRGHRPSATSRPPARRASPSTGASPHSSGGDRSSARSSSRHGSPRGSSGRSAARSPRSGRRSGGHGG